jgi:hypothetical protein
MIAAGAIIQARLNETTNSSNVCGWDRRKKTKEILR